MDPADLPSAGASGGDRGRDVEMSSGRTRHRAAEFFAGAGLARMGLEASHRFDVTWANDIDVTKARLYRARFGDGPTDHLLVKDVADIRPDELPTDVDLAWASFPCTDVSLAGDREGLAGAESGTWWAFVDRLRDLEALPDVVVAENVLGLATSDGGRDLEALLRSLNDLEYLVDVLAIDGRHFVAQSRPRLFIVATRTTNGLLESGDEHPARPDWLVRRLESFDVKTFHPDLPQLPEGPRNLLGSVEQLPIDHPRWWPADRVARFEQELSAIQRQRLEAMRTATAITWRTAYRRSRSGRPAWEIRADEIAGCLRTVRGGSSKQAVVEAGRGAVRVRWMTPGEYAALMGAAGYPIDGFRDNQVYFGFGDAVVVPVVGWLATNYLDRLLT
jgi:DNA (cytosine-5)-methyltransferase 1